MALLKRIRTVYASSRETYGAPRVHAELRAGGERHGRKRITRLMREANLIGASRRRVGPAPPRDGTRRPGPHRIWWIATSARRSRTSCGWPTLAGFLYLAVVLDAWSRRVVGWAMANPLRAELVIEALEMAVGQRRPKDVIHHSDQGAQYTSLAFGKRCKEAGVRPSMGSGRDAYANAMCESCFATLGCELPEWRRFASQAEARVACFSFIED